MVNISDVGFFFFSSPCRGVHYGAGVISLCVCGQRLVYLAERTVIPGTSPPWFPDTCRREKKRKKSVKTQASVLCARRTGWSSRSRLSALGLLCHTCALIKFDDLRGQFMFHTEGRRRGGFAPPEPHSLTGHFKFRRIRGNKLASNQLPLSSHIIRTPGPQPPPHPPTLRLQTQRITDSIVCALFLIFCIPTTCLTALQRSLPWECGPAFGEWELF